MIIYGSRLYFQRDHASHTGICPSCGRAANLRSFTARRWYHLYFIPVIPGSHVRVLDECSACGQGYELPLDDWEVLRNSDLEDTLEKVRSGDVDREQALSALDLLRWVGDERKFAPAAARILQLFPEDSAVLAQLARSFSYFGMTRESARTMSRLLELNPTTREPSVADSALAPAVPPEVHRSSRPGAPWKAMAVVAFIVVAVFIAAVYADSPERVYVLNGTNEAYTAFVNDAGIHLSPWSHQRVAVGYGDVQVAPDTSDDAVFEPFTVRIRASIFDRIGRQPVYVINPDREAVLVWEEYLYQEDDVWEYMEENQIEAEPSEPRFDFGRQFYRFARVDSAFNDLPATIYDGGPAQRVRRTQLTALQGFAPGEIVVALYSAGLPDEAARYAKEAIPRHPDREVLVRVGTTIMAADEAVELLEPGLDVRPVRVDWHRYYQENLRYLVSEDSIWSMYRRLREAEPDDPDLVYLLGRVTPDPDEALQLFRAASLHPSPSAHAFHAIGHHYWNRGRFEPGLANARKARELDPESAAFLATEEELLLASGEVDVLIDRALTSYGISDDFSDVTRLLFLFGIKGDAESSRNLVRGLLDDLDMEETPDDRVAIMQAAFEEGARNLDAFATECGKVDSPDYRYRSALARGDRATAALALAEIESSSYRDDLVLYSMAARDRDAEAADTLLDRALRQLEVLGPRERRIASWFAEGASPPTLDEFYREATWPTGSVVLLVALSYRHPQMRPPYVKAARVLNYDPSFPGLVLSDLMK